VINKTLLKKFVLLYSSEYKELLEDVDADSEEIGEFDEQVKLWIAWCENQK